MKRHFQAWRHRFDPIHQLYLLHSEWLGHRKVKRLLRRRFQLWHQLWRERTYESHAIEAVKQGVARRVFGGWRSVIGQWQYTKRAEKVLYMKRLRPFFTSWKTKVKLSLHSNVVCIYHCYSFIAFFICMCLIMYSVNKSVFCVVSSPSKNTPGRFGPLRTVPTPFTNKRFTFCILFSMHGTGTCGRKSCNGLRHGIILSPCVSEARVSWPDISSLGKLTTANIGDCMRFTKDDKKRF